MFARNESSLQPHHSTQAAFATLKAVQKLSGGKVGNSSTTSARGYNVVSLDSFSAEELEALKSSAWDKVLAVYAVSPDEVDAVFAQEDPDETVSYLNISAGLVEAGIFLTPEEKTVLLSGLDIDGDGKVSRNEFLAGIQNVTAERHLFPWSQQASGSEVVSVQVEVSEAVAVDVRPPQRFLDTAARLKAAKENFNDVAYPNGEGDVVKAVLESGLTFEEMVLVIFRTKDTIFSCDLQVAGPKLFKMIDRDGNNELSTEEIVLAQVNASSSCWFHTRWFYSLLLWQHIDTIVMNRF
jgi:hypothetical protein